MLNKKIISIFIMLLICSLSFGSMAFAAEDQGIATDNQTQVDKVKAEKYKEISKKYKLERVQKAPDRVIPVKVNSPEELESLLQSASKIKIERVPVSNNESTVSGTQSIVSPSSTYTTYTTDSYKVGIAGYVYLKARVEKGTNTILSVSPYTSFTGFTWGFDWDEYNIGSSIVSGGKDFESWASGGLEYYLLVNNDLMRYYIQEINFEGYTTVFH